MRSNKTLEGSLRVVKYRFPQLSFTKSDYSTETGGPNMYWEARYKDYIVAYDYTNAGPKRNLLEYSNIKEWIRRLDDE